MGRHCREWQKRNKIFLLFYGVLVMMPKSFWIHVFICTSLSLNTGFDLQWLAVTLSYCWRILSRFSSGIQGKMEFVPTIEVQKIVFVSEIFYWILFSALKCSWEQSSFYWMTWFTQVCSVYSICWWCSFCTAIIALRIKATYIFFSGATKNSRPRKTPKTSKRMASCCSLRLRSLVTMRAVYRLILWRNKPDDRQ